MTEQELREKIAEIIFHAGCTGACCECDYSKVSDADTYCKAPLKADALIAAGLTFDKTMAVLAERENCKTLIQKAQYYDQMKHRAEVEEKTAREACGLVFSQEIDEEDWRSVIYEYKAKNKKYCNEVGITDDMLYNYLKEQVEKVLPKERENDK